MQVYPVFEKYQRLLARLGRYDNMGMALAWCCTSASLISALRPLLVLAVCMWY